MSPARLRDPGRSLCKVWTREGHRSGSVFCDRQSELWFFGTTFWSAFTSIFLSLLPFPSGLSPPSSLCLLFPASSAALAGCSASRPLEAAELHSAKLETSFSLLALLSNSAFFSGFSSRLVPPLSLAVECDLVLPVSALFARVLLRLGHLLSSESVISIALSAGPASDVVRLGPRGQALPSSLDPLPLVESVVLRLGCLGERSPLQASPPGRVPRGRPGTFATFCPGRPPPRALPATERSLLELVSVPADWLRAL